MAARNSVSPLDSKNPLVDPETGAPTLQFVRLWEQLFGNESGTYTTAKNATPKSRLINTSGQILGGNDLTDDLTLTHADSGVVAGAYTSANITVDAQGHVTAATSGAAGGGWSVVASWTWSTNVTAVTLTGLGSYSDLLIIVKDMTLSSSGFRFIQASIDGGATVFSTSGDYKTFSATGIPASNGDFCGHSTATVSAVSMWARVRGNIAGATKAYTNNQTAGYFANASLVTSAMNAIRLGVTAGNITAGSITILGR